MRSFTLGMYGGVLLASHADLSHETLILVALPVLCLGVMVVLGFIILLCRSAAQNDRDL